MVKKYDHVHKLEFVALGKDFSYHVYRCVLPKCSYYIQKKLAMNKETQCWGCGLTIILNPSYRSTKRPKCKDCRSNKGKYKKIEKTTDSPLPFEKKIDEVKVNELLDLLVTRD